MGWAKLDDLYDDHGKIRRAWLRHPRAVGLHSMAITHCARHESDGVVDDLWIEERLPKPSERAAVLAVLVELELFHDLGDGRFEVHDYLDYNPSAAELEERRARDRERKKKPNGAPQDSTRKPNGSQTESEHPGPARPVPTPPGERSAAPRDPGPPPEGATPKFAELWARDGVAVLALLDGKPLEIQQSVFAWFAEEAPRWGSKSKDELVGPAQSALGRAKRDAQTAAALARSGGVYEPAKHDAVMAEFEAQEAAKERALSRSAR